MIFLHIKSQEEADMINRLVNAMELIVSYTHPGCGHCQELKPQWQLLQDRLKNNYDGKFAMAEIESDAMPYISSEYDTDIAGYPTILHLRNGKKVSEFNDSPRSAENLEKWLKKSLGSQISRKSNPISNSNTIVGGKKHKRYGKKNVGYGKPAGEKI